MRAQTPGRLSDRLVREFGADNVFLDFSSIPLGANFVERLTKEVHTCDALLAVIGPDWLDVRDEEGKRRLDNPQDFVRIEISAALQRNIAVIPILLNGTKIPPADRLPPEMQELTLRNALDLRLGSFHSDVDRLIAGLTRPRSYLAAANWGSVRKPEESLAQKVEKKADRARSRAGTLGLIFTAMCGLVSLYVITSGFYDLPYRLEFAFVSVSLATMWICFLLWPRNAQTGQRIIDDSRFLRSRYPDEP
ncbi:hypothetical protein ABID65_005391 [Bradyrhizobium sp. S3.9.2]|uniref:toll/interleukin-1 receptor domain-containing protein n=1 Tax=Bradyrhizobium sp. S3.9.2 TaxID=3156432 RepID=UPI003397ADCD